MSAPLTVDNQALLWFTLASALLIIKCFVSNFWMGITRNKTGTLGAVEDAMFGAKSNAKAWDAFAHPTVLRAQRIVLNDQENIPLWFMTAILFLITGASAMEARNYFIPFVIARYLHSIIYWNGLQPYRAIIFFVGFFLTIGPLVTSLYRLSHMW